LFSNGQDARSTKSEVSCGTGILPVLENDARSGLYAELCPMHIQHFPHLITAFILATPGVFLLTSFPSFAVPIDRLVAPEPLNTLAEKPFAQVNSVSQLSDVKQTDWAFQALQSLVGRYGCIAGYPDGTYRGNRAMTRYEFAAGLNSCLDRVSELIAAGTTNLITGEDLAIVQKLQAEFATELSVLRGRVDSLDARTAQLEANQFSTTTKLNAEIIVVVTDTSRNSVGDSRDRTNTIVANRGRLNFETSFTGRDMLRTRLEFGNLGRRIADETGTNMTENLGASPVLLGRL
jgi:hypothetical protein